MFSSAVGCRVERQTILAHQVPPTLPRSRPKDNHYDDIRNSVRASISTRHRRTEERFLYHDVQRFVKANVNSADVLLNARSQTAALRLWNVLAALDYLGERLECDRALAFGSADSSVSP
jgi:hypothetical protein